MRPSRKRNRSMASSSMCWSSPAQTASIFSRELQPEAGVRANPAARSSATITQSNSQSHDLQPAMTTPAAPAGLHTLQTMEAACRVQSDGGCCSLSELDQSAAWRQVKAQVLTKRLKVHAKSTAVACAVAPRAVQVVRYPKQCPQYAEAIIDDGHAPTDSHPAHIGYDRRLLTMMQVVTTWHHDDSAKWTINRTSAHIHCNWEDRQTQTCWTGVFARAATKAKQTRR